MDVAIVLLAVCTVGLAVCTVGVVIDVWGDVTRPNLRCRWLGHGILIRDGWAICARCGWREALPELPE